MAAVLAVIAIAATVVLQFRAEDEQEARVKIVLAVGDLNQLQNMPWDADLPGHAGPVARLLRTTEDEITARLHSVGVRNADRMLQQNYATLADIYRVAAAGRRETTDARPLADRAKVTLAATTTTLMSAADARERLSERTRIVGTAGAVLVIVLLFAAFLLYHRRSLRHGARQQQAREAAESAQAELAGALAKLQRAQEDRVHLLARTVEGAESERRRIAADLHDGPIQRLTAAAFTLDLLMNRIARGERDVTALAAQVRDHLASEMASLRRLMAELRPPVLDEGGVAVAIRDAAAEILGASTAFAVHDHTSAARFTPDVETVIHRVAREALVNVHKHAHASQVTVRLERTGNSLRLQVVDDGVGFEEGLATALPPGTHVGLLTVRERVESAGGTLRIVSGPGLGTQMDMTFPWKSRHHDVRPEEVQRAVA